MDKPELIMVVGCNAAGKSTFIRTRLNEFEGFEILMTDVYKGRTKALVKQAISKQRNIVLETVFNDSSFSELADQAKAAGYQTALVVLFLDNLQESITRVGFRSVQQSGITISGSNVKINFNESFKNVATYFFYFDRSDFIYTGVGNENELIMSFKKGELTSYHYNELTYPQKFAQYSYLKNRLNEAAHRIILENKDFAKQQD